MPKLSCEGPPFGVCPYKPTGDDVSIGWGDLDLCYHCNLARRNEEWKLTDNTIVKQRINRENSFGPPISTSVTVSDINASNDNVSSTSVNGSNAMQSGNNRMLVQPLLAYIVFALQSGTTENIKNAVLGYFTEDQITEAKDALWDYCGKEIIGEKPSRKGSNSRTAGTAHLMDILTAWAKLESVNKLPNVVIDALSLGVIPRSHPEELNNICLLDRLNKFEKKMSQMQLNIDEVMAQNLAMKDQMSTMSRVSINSEDNNNMETYAYKLRASNKQSNQQVSKQREEKLTITPQSTQAVSMQSPIRNDNNISKFVDSEGFQQPPQVIRKVIREEKKEEKKKNRLVVTGNSKTIDARVRGAPPPSRDLFVYRVDKDTSDDDLENYVKEKGFTVRMLSCISKPESRFNSYKLTVPASEFKQLFDSDVWPQGVRVRKFFTKRQGNSDNNG